MGGSELYFIIAVIAGFGFILGRGHWRRRRHLAAAQRQGLLPVSTGLTHLPAQLADTVLFRVGDGGHERQVSVGAINCAKSVRDTGSMDANSDTDSDLGQAGHQPPAEGELSEDVSVTVFDFTFQRDVRGEWGYLETLPRFRIFSPLTVVAFELPVDAPHLLLKRRGAAELIAEEGLERYKSVADIARDISTIERAIAVPPPGSLPVEPEPIAGLGPDYLLWAENAEWARALLDRDLCDYLRAPARTGRELVVEILGPLLLVYCAKDGDLSGADADRFVAEAKRLYQAVWARLPAIGEVDSP